MALSFLNNLVCFFLLPNLALSSPQLQSYQQQRGSNNYKPSLKSLHFTGYLHETINKTGYFVVKGVAGSNHDPNMLKLNPFGSLFAFNDRLTATPDPSSKLLGYIQGSCITTSFDGEMTCNNWISLKKVKGYKGEILNVGAAYFTKFSELPIVGGTGDFRFVQGYLIQSDAVQVSSATSCFKMDFHLYWPPFVALTAS